jgi:hypothetical protein
MRRLIAALTIVFIGLWAAGAPVWAITETQELNNTVSGPFSGTTEINLPRDHASCPARFPTPQKFDLTVRPAPDNPHQPRMLGTLHIDACFEVGSQGGGFPYIGTFLFTSSRGATLYGTVGGLHSGTPPIFFEMGLGVRGGTSSFKGVTGSIRLSGQWSTDPLNPDGVRKGPASGTSTGALRRPK